MAEPARQLDDTFSSPTGAFSRGSVGSDEVKIPDWAADGAHTADSDNGRPAANDNELRVEERQDSEQRSIRNVEVTTGKSLKAAGTTAQVVGTGTQVAGATTQVAGKTLQAAGTVTKATGKVVGAGGSALMRAGVAASSTGIGAVVGVPTAVLGAGVKVIGVGTQVAGTAMKATGKAAEKTGKATSKVGKTTRKIGKGLKKTGKETNTISDKIERLNPQTRNFGGRINSLPSQVGLRVASRIPGPYGKVAKYGIKTADALWERRTVTRANTTIFSVGFGLYPIHLALAMASLGALGVSATIIMIRASIESASKKIIGDTATYYLGKVYEYTIGASIDAFSALFSKIFGFSPFAAFDPASWFVGLQYLVVVFGWGMLTFAVITYLAHMVNPFTGKGAAWKMGGFMISAFAYLVPGLNILPWFALYTACVWKNPE